MSKPQVRIVLRPGGDWEVEVAECECCCDDEWKTIIFGESIAELVKPLRALIERLQELHCSIKHHSKEE